MPEEQKLSLSSAILINVNTMLGGGVFINTVNLSKFVGFFGFASYIVSATFLLPLILSIANLLKFHPQGGFYIYGSKEFNPFVGFIAAWAYFVGKLASASLLIHIFSLFLQTIVPSLQCISPFWIDVVIVLGFMWLNSHNIQTSQNIVYAFLVFKLTPIIFALLSSLYLFNHWSIPANTLLWQNIPMTIPIVLYAFFGFESACSISALIKDPEKNAPKAIFYSFAITVGITIAYQLLVFLAVGPELAVKQSFLNIFPTLFSHLFAKSTCVTIPFLNILHLFCASALIGGSYSMMFSTLWNFNVLAKNKHIPYASFFTKLNKYGIPSGCILAQGVLNFLYIFGTSAHQLLLQQISVLGLSIAYLISILALLSIYRKNKNVSFKNKLLAWIALANCFLFIGMCIRNFGSLHIEHLAVALGILFFGIIAFYSAKKYN